MKVVVVDGYGVRIYVRRGCVVMESSRGRKIVPVAEVDRIVIATSGTSITSKAVRVLARYGVDIVFLDPRGTPITCLTPPWITATVSTRRAQYRAYTDGCRATEIAKSFAEAKILNQGLYVKYLAKTLGVEGLAEESERIAGYAEQLSKVFGDVEEARKNIMSIEAAAARVYWGAIASVLPRDLGFDGRDQDGVDQVNRVLNYLYGILYAECFKTLARHGLDPYAGFLHTDRSGNPTLVYDFVEMFRVSAVDSLVVKLFMDGFRVRVDERGFIAKEDRARLVSEFYRWLDRSARDAVGEVKKVREHINSYAIKLGRALRDNTVYRGFVERWWR